MEIEQHKENLKKYIEEDITFREPIKNMSDFDRYCYNHCKDIEAVLAEINKLNNVIDKLTKYIEELTGSCPYDTFDYQVRDCEKECKNQMAECWKEYFMKQEQN